LSEETDQLPEQLTVSKQSFENMERHNAIVTTMLFCHRNNLARLVKDPEVSREARTEYENTLFKFEAEWARLGYAESLEETAVRWECEKLQARDTELSSAEKSQQLYREMKQVDPKITKESASEDIATKRNLSPTTVRKNHLQGVE
jgi:hypothetical protein